jgi:hypothetical protein
MVLLKVQHRLVGLRRIAHVYERGWNVHIYGGSKVAKCSLATVFNKKDHVTVILKLGNMLCTELVDDERGSSAIVLDLELVRIACGRIHNEELTIDPYVSRYGEIFDTCYVCSIECYSRSRYWSDGICKRRTSRVYV